MLNHIKTIKTSGFSLIEILVSISILLMIVMGLSQSFPYGAAIVKTSEKQTRAIYIAQSKIESLISDGYFYIPVGELEYREKIASSSSPLYDYERSTSVYFIDSNLISTSTNPAMDIGMKLLTIDVFFNNPISGVEDKHTIRFIATKR